MATIADEFKCVIRTKDGPICGYIEKTDDGTFYKFKSIPYANPPLGNLRFLPPIPIKAWTEVKDCTIETPSALSFQKNKPEIYGSEDCLYIEVSTPSVNPDKPLPIYGSEDCLYIEVSTPSVNPDKPLPVMFWIGCNVFAFTMDQILDPTLVTARDVVFVRCSFRLGPFGFLSVNDFTAPGNCGLKDIVVALKWVQRNISHFGGDPSNVTIFGSSTGGAIVHMMTLSPMAAGLFHKAIIQSACALNNWSLTKNPIQRVMELGNLLGVNKSHKTEIVDELRSLPAAAIMEAFREMIRMHELDDSKDIIDAIFKPCIEIEFEGQPTFLTKYPAAILKTGNFNKVPLIIGSNNIEAAILQFKDRDFYDLTFEKYNKNKNLLVPKSLAVEPNVSKIIGHQLLKFYLGGEEELREDTKAQYLQLITDYYFLYYVNKSLRLHRQYAPECPIYYYILNYAGEWSVPTELRFVNSMGHSAEVPFIFRLKLPELPVCKGSRDSVTTRCRIVKMWTNFAKYGNPTPDEDDPLLHINWDPVESKDKLNYLSIGAELTKGINPYKERMSFWDDLHKEHMFLRALVYFTDLGVCW